MVFKKLLLASAACLSIGNASLIADECTINTDYCVTECQSEQEGPCPKNQAIKAIEQAVQELDKAVTQLLTNRSIDGASNSQALAQALTNQYQKLMTVYKASSELFSQAEKEQLKPLLKDVYAKVLKFQDKQNMIVDLVSQTHKVLEKNN